MENFRLKFHLLCDLRFCLSGVTSNDTLGCIKVLRSNISPSSPLLYSSTQTTAKELKFCLSVPPLCSHLRREVMRNGKPSKTTIPVAQIGWGSAEKRNYNSVKEMGLQGEQLSHNYFSDVFKLSAEPCSPKR